MTKKKKLSKEYKEFLAEHASHKDFDTDTEDYVAYYIMGRLPAIGTRYIATCKHKGAKLIIKSKKE